MPSKTTVKKASQAKRQGKAPTTQAGAFVEEEMQHAKSGKHPVKSRKQAIAIGLSKARKEGVKVPRKRGATSSSTTRKASTASKGRRGTSGTRKSRSAGARKSSSSRKSASK